MSARKFSTSGVDAGARLDDWLAARLGLEVAAARALVGTGAVHLDGRRSTQPDRILDGGEKIVVHEPGVAPAAEWQLIHEEADIVVVDKPPGLAVIRGRAGGAALEPLVAARWPGVTAFHRIDDDTSGLVLFARRGGHAHLAAALAAGQLERSYLAVVTGPAVDREIEAPIGVNPADRRRMAAGAPGGKPARTSVAIVRRVAARTLVRARLSTGRTHQIRVHLSSVGCPIVGDRIYGGAPASRLALHAAALVWPGGPRLESALPDEVEALLARPA